MASGTIPFIASLAPAAPPGGVTDANDLPSGVWYCSGCREPQSGMSNLPGENTTNFNVICMAYGAGKIVQLAMKFGSASVYYRAKNNSTWLSWTQLQTV